MEVDYVLLKVVGGRVVHLLLQEEEWLGEKFRPSDDLALWFAGVMWLMGADHLV